VPAELNTLVDPGFMVDGPNGSVIADPSKIGMEAPTEKPADTERPAWLPEKFKTAEDFAKAYGELESKLGKPKTDDAPKAPTAEEATAKGIDLAALTAEYKEKGALSAESLTKLEAAGFTKAHVEQFIAGGGAKVAAVRAEFAEIAGGDEQLGKVLEWAKTGLDAAEQAAYDELLDAGKSAAAKLVFKSIVDRYTADVGSEPALVEGERVPSMAGVKPFLSDEQLVAAMSDPRYKAGDKAYHAQVQRRLSISNY
jgi:hypothetical protein